MNSTTTQSLHLSHCVLILRVLLIVISSSSHLVGSEESCFSFLLKENTVFLLFSSKTHPHSECITLAQTMPSTIQFCQQLQILIMTISSLILNFLKMSPNLSLLHFTSVVFVFFIFCFRELKMSDFLTRIQLFLIISLKSSLSIQKYKNLKGLLYILY